MSADQKKSLVKMYLVLSLICFIIIVSLYLVEIFIIHPTITSGHSNHLWFSYVNNIIYGIFTGVLTGLAISFYEYRQQIYLDIYTYIKDTRECVTITLKLLYQKDYNLCLLEIEKYNQSVKDTFIIRKLRKKNVEIYNTIEKIKKDMKDLNHSITQINNDSNSLSLLNKQSNDLMKSFFLTCDSSAFDEQLKASLLDIKKKQKKIESKIGIATSANQIPINKCVKQLKEVESLSISLYDQVNKACGIFLL